MTGAVVYFIQCGDAGPIKIGFTDGDVERRRCSLQGGCPYPLTLLATMPGAAAEEAELHARFASAHTRGEWFWPVAELTRFIANLGKPPVRPSARIETSGGNPMRKLREEMGLTQAELGEHFGTKQSHICRLEKAPQLRHRTLLALHAVRDRLAADEQPPPAGHALPGGAAAPSMLGVAA